MQEFHGVFPYLVSPIAPDGSVLEAELRRLVDHLIASGVHGLTPLGSTGEFAYLDAAQRRRIVEIVVSQTAGRVPVVAAGASASGSLRFAAGHASSLLLRYCTLSAHFQ
jgi:4-hydroxy-tetrahydrodipicolinate synthase